MMSNTQRLQIKKRLKDIIFFGKGTKIVVTLNRSYKMIPFFQLVLMKKSKNGIIAITIHVLIVVRSSFLIFFFIKNIFFFLFDNTGCLRETRAVAPMKQ